MIPAVAVVVLPFCFSPSRITISDFRQSVKNKAILITPVPCSLAKFWLISRIGFVSFFPEQCGGTKGRRKRPERGGWLCTVTITEHLVAVIPKVRQRDRSFNELGIRTCFLPSWKRKRLLIHCQSSYPSTSNNCFSGSQNVARGIHNKLLSSALVGWYYGHILA